jgi:hypothetical chaperone protein
MSHTVTCGVDFGTSNSSVAISEKGNVSLVPVEEDHLTIPTAIFYPVESTKPVFGRSAVEAFLTRKGGRFMRSLKRVLGTSLMKHGTVVNDKSLKFERIISTFIKNLKDKTESYIQQEIDQVVVGRPVHFIDNDISGDKRAQQELHSIFQSVGFTQIEFQFEPIAAAFAHEQNISSEKLALVVDLGGGTSDFTVIRLSSSFIGKADRSADILANTGVRIGGNDFDKLLSLSAILPELGYLSRYGSKNLEVPLKYYHDLAEWSKVNFLYTPKNRLHIQQLLHESHDKKRFGRLLKIVEQENGHSVLAAAEEIKIALTRQYEYDAPFNFLVEDLVLHIKRDEFEQAIRMEVDKITSAARACLKQAGVSANSIELVILTGGSTEIPLVQSSIQKLVTEAQFADENRLSSVGLGLAYDSRRRFF